MTTELLAPAEDLLMQLGRAVADVRAANPELDLYGIVDAGQQWRLPRGQKVFRALEQFAQLAGAEPLPAVPGAADGNQRARFVAELENLLAA
ncbi:hypothetical protein M6D93_07190 [Jatrophihabitans telluris]|uniref:Uncharacterized protein n=1 Tax=Jatrophihabitans telluris TaxID=2038343 RepID=A0ABY4R1H6_9ACTN|nr:hypothetical protein [Jatrophihabitans telluris]UQX89778.1 hypothetical protein M6D93_07190 [Jatrophihabitans telluris]